MIYTIDEAKKEAQKILDSVKRNNNTIKIDTLIKWFKENCSETTHTEPAWDRYDHDTTYQLWAISKYGGYNNKPRNSIEDIINEIISYEKDV